MLAGVRAELPAARDGRDDRRRGSGRRQRPRVAGDGRSGQRDPGRSGALPRAAARHRRPDQHPVHERHDGQSEGRHAHASQHLEQRPSHGPQHGLHARSTGCASPCRCTTASGWGSATWAASRRVRRWCTRRQASTRWRRSRRLAEEQCTSRVRRADDVHRHARAPAVRGVRHLLAAHGDHGGSAVPGRGDEAGRRRDARTRDLHRLRHDRDGSGVVRHSARGRHRATREHGRHRAAERRGQGRRSRKRSHGAGRHAGRGVHARLPRHAAAIGTTPKPPTRRSTKRAGCTRATSA